MATLVLSAVGAAAGASIGGGVLGLSSVVIGRAIGATAGRLIDQSILGSGSKTVETGKIDRFRLTGAAEGAAIKRLYGSQRVGGHVIWASRFLESSTTSGVGKSSGGRKTLQYSYSVSLAIALCEGPITRVGRIWADGNEISTENLNIRVYHGGEDQLPDPKIEAVEGVGTVPAYRGLAYVVFEDLELADFGNRVPQFSFEVVRGQPPGMDAEGDLSTSVRAVALVPGTGEYALATTPLHYDDGLGASRTANVHTAGGQSDFDASLSALTDELPECGAASLVVSWFGDDLRCGECRVEPKVEQGEQDAVGMAWRAGGLSRSEAQVLPRVDDRPIYGGTPADASVIEAIAAMKDAGVAVMFYPFLLMDQLEGNTKPDPWTGAASQPVLPWRGRITLSVAPGRAGSPDQTLAAQAEVDAFFGTAAVGDFSVSGGTVSYSGPVEFSYRRFILHYAHLCALAGGVDAFCVGSELRALTQIRSGASDFPVVEHLRQLAADVRAILGPETKISYAADWSEYFGYQPQDGSGDVFFHLDPFWADANVDFVGIDNYMPLSDWRGTPDEADGAYGSIYNLAYLRANIDGGEGYDWYYHAPEAAEIQLRTPIEDGAYGEDWVFRYKDIAGWWGNQHHDRPGGVRESNPTGWVPESKPIWFTEIGTAAIDKSSNEPNKFYDPKSSESAFPKYSSGQRDDLIQMQFIRAHAEHWSDPGANPVSALYGGQMVDPERVFVWAWDARPFPAFPGRTDLWSDFENYELGHWLNGRSTARSLASVVSEVCEQSNVENYDVSELYGIVRGYTADRPSTGREDLQPLMLAYGFDASERDERIVFANRPSGAVIDVVPEQIAVNEESDADVVRLRSESAQMAGRVRLSFLQAEGDFALGAVEAILPGEVSYGIAETELPLALTTAEAQAAVERWLAEARHSRDRVSFALPQSIGEVHPAQHVQFGDGDRYRIERLTRGETILVEATRVDPNVYVPSEAIRFGLPGEVYLPPMPVYPVFLDLPLITGSEDPVSPAIAVTATPWPGRVAVYASTGSANPEEVLSVAEPSVIGETLNELAEASPDRWDRGPALRVRVSGGGLGSVDTETLLAGANLAAIGTSGSDLWEVFQFSHVDIVDSQTFDLSTRLRGQFGTAPLIQSPWPAGSTFVILDGSLNEVPLSASLRGLARDYRIGPANRPYDDASFVTTSRAFEGFGLRPYAPVHLRAHKDAATGDVAFSWVRCTRIDGDLWSGIDVPLGEAFEQYAIRVTDNGVVVREATVAAMGWTYTQSDQLSDGVSGTVAFSVAQVSDRFGPGLFGEVTIDV